MRGFGCCPPAQQDINANSQVNQRNQPQALIQGGVRRLQNYTDLVKVSATPFQFVGGLEQRSGFVKLVDQVTETLQCLAVYGQEQVTGLDACMVRRPSRK